LRERRQAPGKERKFRYTKHKKREKPLEKRIG